MYILRRTTLLFAFAVLPLCLLACASTKQASPKQASSLATPDASAAAQSPTSSAAIAAERELTENVIRTLEARLKRDPEDFVAANKLAGYYLQRQRETGDANYLALAERAARSSLMTVPAEINKGGLAALAQIEYAQHDFAAARDHAAQLAQLEPEKSYPYQTLGDAHLELGDYDKAANVFRRMRHLAGITAASEARLARLAFLQGDAKAARTHLLAALADAIDADPAVRETTAWCQWQLGELDFAVGDYEAAERRYRESLQTFPDYFRALAGLARTHHARGNLSEAIAGFEQVVSILPDPSFVATLGDFYKLAGRDAEAARQYRLVEQIARLGTSKTLYNRQLAVFYADQNMNAAEAYASAVKDYESRPDIYGADAVAWTALKAGKLDEARARIKEALRLGTPDARLHYHAGIIARQSGDRAAAREHLTRALTLNPHFDPLQSALAREALAAL